MNLLIDFNQFIEGKEQTFEEFLWSQNLSAETVEVYMFYIKPIEKLPLTNKLIAQMVLSKPNSSVLRASIKKFIEYKLYWNPDSQELLTLKIPQVRGRTKKRIVKFWPYEQIKKFAQELYIHNETRLCLIVIIGFEGALRISEILNIRPKNIIYSENCINGIGKGNKEFKVFISSSTSKHLFEYVEGLNIEPDKKIFPISKEVAYKHLRDKSRQYMNLDFNPHLLRHSRAQYWIDEGFSLLEVQQLMRHENIASTSIYTHLDKQKLIDKVREKMG